MFENKIHIYFQIVFYARRGVVCEKLYEFLMKNCLKSKRLVLGSNCFLRPYGRKKLPERKTFSFASSGCCL
jgi:hypothetical protein